MLELPRSAEVQASALHLPATVTWDEYVEIGRRLGQVATASRWWIGDWILIGEALFGEAQAQALDATGLSEEYLLRIVRVAKAFPPSRRRPELSWLCHEVVAGLPEELQDEWLDRAVQEGWSDRELRRQLRDRARREAGPIYRNPEREPVLPVSDEDWEEVREEAAQYVERPDYGECVLCARPFLSEEERDAYLARLRRRP